MIFDGIGRLLFPPKCVLCGKLLEKNETDLCHGCRVDGPECGSYSRRFDFLESYAAVWYYEGDARSSILRFKFGGKRGYAHGYGKLLAMKLLEQHPDGFDLLTWVPTAWQRCVKRGYDQTELIARAVGRELGVKPVKLLKKVRNTPPQSGITGHAERRANVLNAYRLVGKRPVKDKKILLIDDIITTGATAGECARVLLTAGAQEICCGAVAVTRQRAKTR